MSRLVLAGLIVALAVLTAVGIAVLPPSPAADPEDEIDVFEFARIADLGDWVPDAAYPLGRDRASGARVWHEAAPLTDGTVMICGGTRDNPFTGAGAAVESLDACGTYDIRTRTWSRARSIPGMPAVSAFVFAALTGGRAVVFGGVENGVSRPQASTHVYDSRTGRFSRVETPENPGRRAFLDSAALADGRVVVFGGWSCSLAEFFQLRSMRLLADLLEPEDCELFGDTWIFAGGNWSRLALDPDSPAPAPRILHAMTAMDDGRVLLYGGAGSDGELRSDTWILDVNAATWHPVQYADDARIVRAGAGSLSPLGDDRYLLTLGLVSFVDHGMQSWVFDGRAEQWTQQRPTSWAQGGRDYMATFPAGDGRVMLIGGQGNDLVPTSDANVYCTTTGPEC